MLKTDNCPLITVKRVNQYVKERLLSEPGFCLNRDFYKIIEITMINSCKKSWLSYQS